MLSRSYILRSKARSRRNKKTLIGSQSDRISVFFHGMALSVPLSQNIQILIGGAHDIGSRLINEAPFAFDLDAG